jgi:hypothetical protein
MPKKQQCHVEITLFSHSHLKKSYFCTHNFKPAMSHSEKPLFRLRLRLHFEKTTYFTDYQNLHIRESTCVHGNIHTYINTNTWKSLQRSCGSKLVQISRWKPLKITIHIASRSSIYQVQVFFLNDCVTYIVTDGYVSKLTSFLCISVYLLKTLFSYIHSGNIHD